MNENSELPSSQKKESKNYQTHQTNRKQRSKEKSRRVKNLQLSTQTFEVVTVVVNTPLKSESKD